MERIVKIVTSFFGLGYAPIASGTVGSLGGVALYLAFKNRPVIFVAATIAVVLAGMVFSGRAEKVFGKKDPGEVVIDEVAGMMVSLLFLPYNIWILAGAFLLFRIFDVVKPPPARWAEKLPGATGIMLDDIIAGFYANIILQIIVRL